MMGCVVVDLDLDGANCQSTDKDKEVVDDGCVLVDLDLYDR